MFREKLEDIRGELRDIPFIKRALEPWHKRRYGESVIIVSGLPRSGTSMMMKMLDAAGLPIMTDEIRTADVDNPKGYFEYERVKDLEREADKAWVRDARGKVLKVISFLLKDLPDDNHYRVIFVRRHLDEVLASQNKMIEHRGSEDSTQDDALKMNYDRHLFQTRRMLQRKGHFDVLYVDHRQAIKEPRLVAAQVNAFLGGKLDEDAMASVVDKKLYRNRADSK